MANKPKRLLEKYDILLEHLDYGYIEKCTDAIELEKIVKILRSSQEGYYPDLTSFAERQLRSIKPKSKLFRQETPLLTKSNTPRGHWEEITQNLVEWESDMQKVQSDLFGKTECLPRELPPIRSSNSGETNCKITPKEHKRIESCDYENWDRYDPDAELLKMDLEEERQKEFVLKQNERNLNGPIIQEIPPDELSALTEAERRILAMKCKEKGNDYFRSKEYQQALSEYNRSIASFPMSACYNNRAITNIKLMRYKEAVSDCEECLKNDPTNLKALYRKAEAFKLNDERREAYHIYCRILQLDPNSIQASGAIEELRRQLPDLPPANSFQVQIEDETSDDGYAALVKPKKIIKDKLPEMMQSLKTTTSTIVEKAKTAELQDKKIDILPRPTKKVLIEEI
ncbi:sperm-associated antigen 1 [Armigeres subalbatus]|uniref:sperm-associated antigen 1 n=1 Tax=Armigeres subalbatus TaxID=124917 RepID=UPI002ECFBC5E